MLPHVPDSVRSVMKDLAAGLHKILGDRLLAVYLGGSFATGDWCANSDLDFLVVTAGELSPEDSLAISLLHRDLRQTHPLGNRLEGDYAPLELLIPEGTAAPVPGCEQGVFWPRVPEIMISADNLLDMRENGIAFYGPPPAELLPEVSVDLLRSAVQSMIKDGLGPCHSPSEAAAEVLDLVRSLCALQTGAPTTKLAGARWALECLEERWHPIIRAAVAIRQGRGSEGDEAVVLQELAEFDAALRCSSCG